MTFSHLGWLPFPALFAASLLDQHGVADKELAHPRDMTHLPTLPAPAADNKYRPPIGWFTEGVRKTISVAAMGQHCDFTVF